MGSPRSHKCLTGTATLVRYRTRIFQSPIFLFAPKWSGASQSVQPITVTDSPDDSRSHSVSDSKPITFTDSPNDPSSQTASKLPSRTRRKTNEALPFQTASKLHSRIRQTTQQHFHFAPKLLPNCPGQVSARKVSKVNFLQSNQCLR